MKNKLFASLTLVLLSTLNPQLSTLFAQGTAFTYHGRLNDNGASVTGAYDLQFHLYDASEGGNIVAGPLDFSPVDVVNGLFTARIDFGANVFTGPARWLNLGVRSTGGGAFTPLSPRQEVTSSPYAIRAASAATAESAESVANGSVAAGQLNTAGMAPTTGQLLSYDGGNLLWRDPGAGSPSIFSLNGTSAYYNDGNVGIGTTAPAHRLSLAGGPSWTTHQWLGAVELVNGAALGWQANLAGQRFGMGHSSGGFYMFRTASDPGTTGSPALYDFMVDDSGNVGIGTTTPTPGYRLDVIGATRLSLANGTVQFGSPNSELGMSIMPTLGSRADLRFDGSVLKLAAHAGVGPPSAGDGIAITTAGNVGIGTTTPTAKLQSESSQRYTDAISGKASAFGSSGVYGESSQAAAITANATGSNMGIHAISFSGLALFASGDVAQSISSSGIVKSLAYIDPFLPAAQYVVRCFNDPFGNPLRSTAPCGITVTRSGVGFYTIDFGFNVENRFISLTPQAYANVVNGNGSVAVGTITSVSGNLVNVAFFRIAGGTINEDCRFHIAVY